MKPRRGLLIALAGAAGTALVLGVSGAFSSGGEAAPAIDADVAPASDATVVSHAEQTVDGETWSIHTYENAAGQLCFAEQVPGEGQGIGCRTREELFRDGPVWFGVGARQRDEVDPTEWDTIWVDGLVNEQVTTLDLVRTDCSSRQVAFDDAGVFLVVLSKDEITNDVWPHRLVARDIAGGVVESRDVSLDPPSTDQALAAGTVAPSAVGC